ncbi:MAG TPA: M20 family metallopeptidase [Pseudonocardiaceae bacterium]|nr:M20 family metallopeptidase [Pseudonocardiaceae bacterium]
MTTVRVDDLAPELLAISHAIHAEPELGFAEHHAAKLLSDYLAAREFTVTTGVADMPTAFRAERVFGTGGPTIAVFCEYDALPGIGHACGHNIIGSAGAGAGVAAARWLAEHGGNGRLVVFGSPAEEGGGGKVRLIEDGQLSDVDAAVMVHPAGFDAVSRTNLGRVSLEATFTGRASHAAAAPELGRNALDAATLLLVAIGLLRQQLRSDSRVHANVVDGGDAINVIPEHARVALFIRSTDNEYLRGRLYEAVRDCVLGAALATGTTSELTEVAVAYEPVRTNPVLAGLAARVFEEIGRPIEPETGYAGSAGSTDMGNVSQVVPAIHPYVRVAPGVAIHTRDFAAAAATSQGDDAVLAGASMLATVVTELFTRPNLVAEARAAFEEGV